MKQLDNRGVYQYMQKNKGMLILVNSFHGLNQKIGIRYWARIDADFDEYLYNL